MVFRKLPNLVSTQPQEAASKEKANSQPSSDDEQLKPILVINTRSSPTAAEVSVTVVSNKSCKRKRQISESERDEVPVSTATDKTCKRRRKNPEIRDNPDSFKLMMNYFDKSFERIQKKLQQP